jgi:hypothetical protein
MILSDREVDAALDNVFIRIHPVPDRALWTSTAVDLTLDGVLLVWTPRASASGGPQRVRPFGAEFDIKALMDDPAWGTKVPIDPEQGYELHPGWGLACR